MSTDTNVPQSQGKANWLVLVFFWLGIGLVLHIMFCFFAMQAMNGIHAARLLRGHKTIGAMVTKPGYSRDPAYYKFTLNGKEYKGRAGRQDKGRRIQVAYLPDNPSVHRPVDSLTFDAGGLVVMPILLAVAGWFVFRSDKTTHNSDDASADESVFAQLDE